MDPDLFLNYFDTGIFVEQVIHVELWMICRQLYAVLYPLSSNLSYPGQLMGQKRLGKVDPGFQNSFPFH